MSISVRILLSFNEILSILMSARFHSILKEFYEVFVGILKAFKWML